MINGLIYTDDKRYSNVEKCLQQASSMEFEKCLEGENSSSLIRIVVDRVHGGGRAEESRLVSEVK